MLKWLYKRFGHPLGVEKPSSELKEAIKTLGWDVKAWQVISSATILMVLTGVIIAPVFAMLLLQSRYVLAFLLLPLPILTYFVLTEYPKYLAKNEIAKEIGEIPIFLSSLVIFLRDNPNVERAVEFLSNFEGKLFSKLRNMFIDMKVEGNTNGRNILVSLANNYINTFPEFKRSLSLVLNGEYERGLAICMDGIKNKVEEFVNSLNIPTLILFSVGAVFPLVFISLLPAMSLISFDASTLILIVLISSLFVYIYSNLIISKRPVVFPTVSINKEKKVNILWYLSIFLVLSIPSIVFLLGELGLSIVKFPDGYNLIWFIVAITVTLSLYAYFYSRELVEYRDYINSLELNAANLSYNLASLAIENKPIDDKISKIDFSLTPRFRMLGHLIKNSMNKGGERLYELLTSFGDYFSNIDSIRISFFNKLDNIITMMKLTAILFLPLISAVSISVAREISSQSSNLPFFTFSVNLDLLVFITGLYTILTFLLLIRYIIYIKNGPDTVEFMNSVYKNLPFAIGLFIILYSILPEVI